MKFRMIALITLLGLLLSAAVIVQALLATITCADINGTDLTGITYVKEWIGVELEAGTSIAIKNGDEDVGAGFRLTVASKSNGYYVTDEKSVVNNDDMIITVPVSATDFYVAASTVNLLAKFTSGKVTCTPPGGWPADSAEAKGSKATEEPVVTRPGIDTGDAPGLIVPVDPKGNEDKSNPVKVAVYGIDGDNGYLAFAVTVAELTAHKNWPADKPYRSSEDGLINLYILGNNECQVNFGPDAEGKVQEIVFTCDTAELIRRSEFNVNDVFED